MDQRSENDQNNGNQIRYLDIQTVRPKERKTRHDLNTWVVL